MTSEQLHRVLREKLLSTVKTGGGTLLRTYRNLHRRGTGNGVDLADFKEAVYRYGMGVTDAQVLNRHPRSRQHVVVVIGYVHISNSSTAYDPRRLSVKP